MMWDYLVQALPNDPQLDSISAILWNISQILIYALCLSVLLLQYVKPPLDPWCKRNTLYRKLRDTKVYSLFYMGLQYTSGTRLLSRNVQDPAKRKMINKTLHDIVDAVKEKDVSEIVDGVEKIHSLLKTDQESTISGEDQTPPVSDPKLSEKIEDIKP